MMKGFAVDENMSNLTCASGDLSASANSSIRNESSSSTHQQQPTQKKKRNLPGNPGIYNSHLDQNNYCFFLYIKT